VGIGDGALYKRLLAAFDVGEEQSEELLGCLMRRDIAGLEARVRSAGLPGELVEIPLLRGGPEVLDRAESAMGDAGPAAVLELRGLYEVLSQLGHGERVMLDLGLIHELGYYTGAVFEVYDPAVGFALGGGGRYDKLIGRFGSDRPACGLALDVQRVHIAQAAEEKLR
jgi:ATP phosphoribosyltransferase regulatory subunit